MSLNQYQAFTAAVEAGSITKAADRLGYTQSGLSHLIVSLEEELGLTLLQRSKTGVTLTLEGEALLPYALRLLEAEQDVRHKAGDLRGLVEGRVRVGTISSVAVCWLPRLLTRLKERWPGIQVSVRNGDYAQVEEDLLLNRTDCGFVTLPAPPQFTLWPLVQDRLMAVVREGDPLASRGAVWAEDLTDRPFIIPAEGMDYHVGRLFDRIGRYPSSRLDVRDDLGAVALVRAGLGVTVLPELIALALPSEGVRAIPIQNACREIALAVCSARYLSPAARAFVDLAREQLQKG